MKRDIEKELVKWKNQPSRLPLLLRGARQVGKSYIIKEFGSAHFEHFVEINFEYEPEMKACFSSLNPHEILNKIRLMKGATIAPGSTLLFLDEMQECPESIMALRYFYEKMPELHVIGAGSLLEFVFHKKNFRMPVGRVQYLFIKPLSFGEFLTACGHGSLRDHLKTVTLDNTLETALHELLLKFVRQYLLIGGMPKVVDTYLQSKDLSEVQKMQTVILTTYRDDFGKYAESFEIKYLSTLFMRAPRMVSQRFFYKDVDPELRARELKSALEKLQEAHLLYKSYAVSASGIPLGALINEKEFKLFFVDTGLVNRASGLGSEVLLEKEIILVNRGAIAEQFVAQELIAYGNPYEASELYWWSREKRGSSAEVDFVMSRGEMLLPIEVKAGTSGRLRSIKIFIEEKKSPLGIRISQNSLELEKHAQEKLLSVPFYLIEELSRLINASLDRS